MLSRRDIPGVLLAVVLAAVVVAVLVVLPNSKSWVDATTRTNEGFGPEWECHRVATPNGSTPICFKKTKADGPQNSN